MRRIGATLRTFSGWPLSQRTASRAGTTETTLKTGQNGVESMTLSPVVWRPEPSQLGVLVFAWIIIA